MNRDFKFRHVNEIAGVFVIAAVVLFAAGIIFAGKSQGWFEPRFTLNIVFDTPEGSFGLQEGASVMVRNTVAGRVGPILPTPDGFMGTALILKDRFRPFITTDSVAKIKKKFGLAGDSYVDIERGQGAIILDGASIPCIKDEELIETAQRMLSEMQDTLMPIFEKVEAIISSAASILEQVDKGAGIAGAAVGNQQLRDDIISMVSHLEKIALQAESTVGQVNLMISNDVAQVLADVRVLSRQTSDLMADPIPLIAAETLTLQHELNRTLEETRRLITGIQRHWLFRKYMETEPDRLMLLPAFAGGRGEDESRAASLRQDLAQARAADDAERIQRHAYNLAVHELGSDRVTDAFALLAESRFAGRLTGEGTPPPEVYLLEAELCRRMGDHERAAALAGMAIRKTRGRDQRSLQAEARILQVAVYIDAGHAEAATTVLPAAIRAVRQADPSPLLEAALNGLTAAVQVLKGDLAAAADAYGRQADCFRVANALVDMTVALRQAGDLYSRLGMSNSAATLYLRAAVSLAARGLGKEASEVLDLAYAQADSSGDVQLTGRISDVRRGLPGK